MTNKRDKFFKIHTTCMSNTLVGHVSDMTRLHDRNVQMYRASLLSSRLCYFLDILMQFFFKSLSSKGHLFIWGIKKLKVYLRQI